MRRCLLLGMLAFAVTPSAHAVTGRGLYGLVTRSPTTPACSSEEPCSQPAPRRKLRFLRAGSLVATTVTDARGRYRVSLPLGVFTVRVAGAPATGISGLIAPATVRVRAGWRHQNFDIDTGIR